MHRLDLLQRLREIRRHCDSRNATRKPAPFFRAALPGVDQSMKRRFGRPRFARRDDEPAAVRGADRREKDVGMRTSAFIAPEVDFLRELRIREHSEITSALAVQPRRCAMRHRQLRRHRPFRRRDYVRERRVRQKQHPVDCKWLVRLAGDALHLCDETTAFGGDANFKVEHGHARVALQRENPASVDDTPVNAGDVLHSVRCDFVSTSTLRIERALCLNHRRKSTVFLCIEKDLLNGRASADASAEFKPRRVLHAIRAVRECKRRRPCGDVRNRIVNCGEGGIW